MQLVAAIPLSGRAFFAIVPLFYGDGLRAHFLFVVQRTNILQLVESAAIGLGFELVDLECVPRGRLLRVFIDRPADPAGGAGRIALDDCERMTRQLQHLLAVEGVDYERLEVSSPGLDRVLKRPADFRRFSGATVEVRMRVPIEGRRRFVGTLRGASDTGVDLEVDGAALSLDFVNMEKARLVPELKTGPARSPDGKAMRTRRKAFRRTAKTH
jgi:ribosome maturation factor RimP